MAKALELWSPEVIEEALGAEAEGVLPEAVRLIDLHVQLPRHQVAMLEQFRGARSHFGEQRARAGAGRRRQRACGRALMGRDRVRRRVGGPDAEAAQLPC
jgi:hypothetical protein